MTKLVVMIPAKNEKGRIERVIAGVPRKIAGISSVRVLVIDDDSTDGTGKTAKMAGADRIIRFDKSRGLATAFKTGLETALEMGADVIVNIDADGQYDSREIPKLIRPVIEGRVDMVLGARNIDELEDMPMGKLIGNKIVTFIMRVLTGLPITDAQTGFRAFSKEAALRLNILSKKTYVHETIIEAAIKRLKIAEVPITFRRRMGKSRLIHSIYSYATKEGITILKTYRDYNPMGFFGLSGVFILGIGLVLITGMTLGYMSSQREGTFLLLPLALIVIGGLTIFYGFLLSRSERRRTLVEERIYQERKRRLEKKSRREKR